MTPTPEQQQAVDAFARGGNLVIEAGAGTGKTATLTAIAETTARRGQYIAFNRAIVNEAGRKMPRTVSCETAHQLAFRDVGRRYSDRLNSDRMRSREIARRLRIDPIIVDTGLGDTKRMADGYLAGHTMRALTVFCQTADSEPGAEHFPYIDGIDMPLMQPDGTFKRGHDNNRAIAKALAPALRKAWADVNDLDGQLPYKHEHYLKMWQLTDPRIFADFILFDEAQDANPVMAAVVNAQEQHGTQRVFVGDSQQEIYGFTGAVNALAQLEGDRVFLTRSFRFGPAVARTANLVLEWLDAELRLTGTDSIVSICRTLTVDEADVVLCRTNAAAVEKVLTAQQAGQTAALVGGGKEVISFAYGALDLMDKGSTTHRELACFDSWDEVREYVEHDPQGSELKLMVGLVDRFTPKLIVAALRDMPDERYADLIVSTAHKAKGREWGRVMLASDFPDAAGAEVESLEPSELRLLYVAVTRARDVLDHTRVPMFFDTREEVA